jgi:chromosome segregation ATPase
MTVPGKGGRPRKWRSEADRQRAWRARNAGTAEPPTLVQALDDGDELAHAWQTVRDLGVQLDGANATIKRLRRERDRTQREYEREQHRWGWIESRNAELAAARDRLESERDALIAEVADLRGLLARLSAQPAVAAAPASATRPLARAERRQHERRQRRRKS